ncbi:alpha/beta hydrolase [Brevundimonas sp. LM2]|uniref:alpha/beta fold hydrolase BchO n=1 Tax=Brevundimonas sp. LM2 TaxID=1938605 RepID=UPI000983ABCE|nr:alpha/beta fold hydrolase BchO [Brevundimonas sp. LM2]AQR62900.1 alpha/beta hydrolase [Brevundimonas sp. LM2]
MSERPDWAVEGRDWPNRAASRFIMIGDLRWHVQVSGPEIGSAPVILLLHGAGAATHSWRDLTPLLADRFTVVAPDLPGQGFTVLPPDHDLSLWGMARRTTALIQALDVQPSIVVAHSAGAAIALRMSLDGRFGEAPIIAVNGALQPFAGAVAPLFRGLALGLFVNPLAVHLFASAARDRSRVARLIRGTGSMIDDRGLDLYGRLLRKPGHVAGTLGMMGRWDISDMLRSLPQLRAPLTLVVGSRDQAVPPSVAQEVRAILPDATVVPLPGLGHLAHEERPDLIAGIVTDVATAHGLLQRETA